MTTIDEAMQLVLEAEAEIKRLRSALDAIELGIGEWDDEPETVNWGTYELSREEMQAIARRALGPSEPT